MAKLTRKQVKAQVKGLRKQEAGLVEAIATSIANRDDLEQSLTVAKGERKRSEDLAALNGQIRKDNEKIAQVRKNLKKRRRRVRKIRLAIRRKAKRLRNTARPKVIDLKLNFKPMDAQGSVHKVIGHYTAGPQDKNTKDAIRLCRIYHQAHLNQGWSGEGYALCFTVDGNILVLRPAQYVGAHTLGANTGSIGIMMHGTTGDRPNKAQKRALRWWAKNGHKRVMGKGRTRIVPGKVKWFGHKQFNPTACPGSFLEAYESKGQRG